MKTTDICMLGGAGFVGGHLASRLASAGHNVTILTRNRERHRRLLVLPTVRLRQGDVYDRRFLEAAIAQSDIVINLVGILNEKGRNGKGFEKAHVTLADTVIDACIATGTRRLLHMSALRADADRGPSHYLRTKGEAERLIMEKSGDNIAWTMLQPSVIFGPDDSFTLRFAQLLRLTPLMFPLARPDARFAPVFIGDVVDAFVAALNDPRSVSQSYQLCGPDTATLREIVQFIAVCLGLRRRIVGLPDSISKVQARVCEWLPGKPFSFDNYLSLTVPSVCDDNGFARLGLTPRSFRNIVPTYLSPES